MDPILSDLGEDFYDEVLSYAPKSVRWHGSSANAWSTGIPDAPLQPFRSLLPERPNGAAATFVETPRQEIHRKNIEETTIYMYDATMRHNIREWADLYHTHGTEAILVVVNGSWRTRLITIGVWIAYLLTCQMQKAPITMSVATEDILRATSWGFFTMPPLDYLPEFPPGHFDAVTKYMADIHLPA